MPGQVIIVQRRNRANKAVLTDSNVKLQGANGIQLTKDNKNITIGRVTAATKGSIPYYLTAAVGVLSNGGYISNIAGATSNTTGDVWIDQDGCISVFPNYHGVNLFNTCPNCTPCSITAEIFKKIQLVRTALNAQKDINLYRPNICDARKAALEAHTNENLPEGCELEYDFAGRLYSGDALAALARDSRRLFGQYAAMIHMWNYIASSSAQVNTVSRNAKNDFGVDIRARQYINICDKNSDATTIDLTIRFEPAFGNVTPGLSLYIPEPTLDSPSREAPISSSVSAINATTKEIRVSWNIPSVNGVFFAGVQVLGFLDANGAIVEPTQEQYKTGMGTNVRQSADAEDQWKVTITWSGPSVKDGVSTYYIATNKIKRL